MSLIHSLFRGGNANWESKPTIFSRGRCAAALWYGLHWHTEVNLLQQSQANAIKINLKIPVIGRKWVWNQPFSRGTRLSSRNCMSAIWIIGKNPVYLFIHLMLGLFKSQKNCHDEIRSCTNASRSMHLARSIVSAFASSRNTAPCSAATNLGGNWVKKKCFLLFTCQVKNHRLNVTSSLRNCPRPASWQLRPWENPQQQGPAWEPCPHWGEPLRETVMTVFTQGNKGTPLRKVIVGICFQECHGLHVRDLRTLGVVKSLSEERGWQNGFTPVLRRNGDAVRKSCPRSVMTAFFSTDDNF